MASYTPNYNLKKPADSDYYDIADDNGNMDKIDTALNTLNAKITTHDFGSNTLANIQSAMVTYAGSMSNYQSKPIAFALSEISGSMPVTAYVGFLFRVAATRLTVNIRQSMNANCAYIGNYKDGTWYWDQLALKSELGCTKRTVTLTAGSKCSIPAQNSIECNGILYINAMVNVTSQMSQNDPLFTLPSTIRFTRRTDYQTHNGTLLTAMGNTSALFVTIGTLATGTYDIVLAAEISE